MRRGYAQAPVRVFARVQVAGLCVVWRVGRAADFLRFQAFAQP